MTQENWTGARPHQRALRTQLLLWVALACSGCGSSLPYTWVQELPPAHQEALAGPIQPGDTVSVFVQEQETLSGDFIVRQDGSYAQPIVGAVQAAGKTPEELAAHLKQRLQGILSQPVVSVGVAERRPLRVGVIGEVNQAGLYEAKADEGVLGLLSRAGGLNDFADEDEIYVVRKQPELKRIRMRFEELLKPETAATRFRLMDGDTIVVE